MNPENHDPSRLPVLDLPTVSNEGPQPNRLMLAHARTAVARRDHSRAEMLLEPLVDVDEDDLAARAKIQLALVRHQLNLQEQANQLLKSVISLIKTWRTSREEVPPVVRDRRRTSELRSEVRSQLELELECARAWSRIGCAKPARNAYALLLTDWELAEPRTPDRRRIVALAEFRLAELLIHLRPEEAYSRWRRALEMRDEEVSPHAALRMATDLGGKLVAERVERLFNIAMEASDPVLSSEAVLGLARHFEGLRQFNEARKLYETVIEYDSDDQHVDAAAQRLGSLDRLEWMVEGRDNLTRSRQLCSLVQKPRSRSSSTKRVLVVGAGTGGSYLADSLDRRRYEICGFVDDWAYDAPAGFENRLLGHIDELIQIIDQHCPDQVLLAIPTLAGAKRKAVVDACSATRTPLLNLPRMHELGIGWTREENRSRLMTQLRPVRIEEMIGERRVVLDANATKWLRYQTVLVIGAGALGAEICRRLVDGEVGKIVVADRRPSALRKIEEELFGTREFKEVEFRLGDAGNSRFLTDVLRSFAPYAIFNTTGDATASALEPEGMKADPDGWKEVLRNEVKVVSAVARAASLAEVPHTVHVSSPRAADPDTPFGAMKALCEEIALWHSSDNPQVVQAVVRVGAFFDSQHGHFAKLRRQIQAGQSVTIPNPEQRPRFISIARWAELVLQSAHLAANGELLEPDGGVEFSPRDIAEQAIRLSNLYPDEVQIDESTSVRWVEPRPAIERFPKGGHSEIFSVDRGHADRESVDIALMRCSERIARHASSDGSEPLVRDILEGFVAGELEIV
jgi:FlaA1/EpsC-like NDP-sugar epimerase